MNIGVIKQALEYKAKKPLLEHFNINACIYSTKRKFGKSGNSFEIVDKKILFYPPNDGNPTYPFEYYKGKNLVLTNLNAFHEITNLDDILLEIIDLENEALDQHIIINPFYFMLELEGEIKENYKGKAKLLMTPYNIANHLVDDEKDFEEVNKYFINRFLDHFMCWNFGYSIERNEVLKEELETLNERIIDMGIRQYAGRGHDVKASYDKEGYLQVYRLKTEKENLKKLVLE